MPLAAIMTRSTTIVAKPNPALALEMEARALLTRLSSVKPFALQETMVAAAALTTPAQSAIDRHLIAGRRRLHQQVIEFVRWLHTNEGRMATPQEMQRRFTLLRLRFNIALTQLDIFSVAVTQRSENETGVWLAGLDVAAADALKLVGQYF